MAKYAVINILTGEWEHVTNDLENARAHLHLLRKHGVAYVLVQIIEDNIPDISD